MDQLYHTYVYTNVIQQINSIAFLYEYNTRPVIAYVHTNVVQWVRITASV